MTERLYADDPYLLSFVARVVARLEHEGRPAVVLDRTAFYPEGGGQPCDLGRLGGAAVTAVLEQDGEVVHVLEHAIGDETVEGAVEGERRRDHRQQHHGQHLLSRAFEELAGARTIGFHLGASDCTVDLDREVTREQAEAAARRASEVAWEARPVRVVRMSRAEAAAAGLDPSEHVGDSVRVVEVEGYDRNPCGGTHPRSTAEVGLVLLLSTERYKGGSRVHFACGHRALAEQRRRLQVLDAVAGAVEAPLAELHQATLRLLERAAASDKRGRELLDWALAGEARRLLSETVGSPAIVVRAYDGWPAADLRTLAVKLTCLGSCVALLGSRAEKAHLVFAQSPGLGHDIPGLLKDALGLVGGRGGGRGDLAQGGGDRVEQLGPALERAAATVRARSVSPTRP